MRALLIAVGLGVAALVGWALYSNFTGGGEIEPIPSSFETPYHSPNPVNLAFERVTYAGLTLAQAETAPPAATAETVEETDTFVDLGPVVRAWTEALMAAIGSIVAAAIGWLVVIAKNKFNIDIEARHREALQTALTNGAGLLIEKAPDLAEGIRINVRNEKLAGGIEYVLRSAPDALKYFGLLDPSDIAEKLVAKAKVIAATGTPTPVVGDAQ